MKQLIGCTYLVKNLTYLYIVSCEPFCILIESQLTEGKIPHKNHLEVGKVLEVLIELWKKKRKSVVNFSSDFSTLALTLLKFILSSDLCFFNSLFK